ncbi:MAG TPA: D-alanyl-D-alanine carboxypeptidase family protein [Steroidobacteraceae bacterium]|nr:D-alanyl-D-alanine carboxypeptidase family protein [Steroidobacteraceae bacterium]
MRILPALLLLAASAARAAAPVPPPPTLEASSWVLVDNANGKILAGHRADVPVEPASITKLMTQYAVFHALKEGKLTLDQPVPISEHAWRSEGSRTYLDLNSRVPVEVLIQGMIVQSGNDATIALAEAIGGTEETFAALMNQYAERLGMKNSHFANSTGLPAPGHQMSAADMAKLARAIIREFPDYYRWYSQREFTWNRIRQQNRNGLLDRDPSVDGMKTGMTEAAGYCLVSSAKRDGMRLIAVVTGTKSMRAREDASLALLNWGFNFFETRVLKKAGEALAMQRIYRARGGEAAVGLASDLTVTLPRGGADKVEYTVELAPKVFAPLTRSDRVGTLRATVDGKVIAEAPIQPLADVPKGNIFRRIWDTIMSWFA